MKVTSYETVEVEVETNIDLDDIAGCLTDDLEKNQSGMFRAINNFKYFMDAMPEDVIKGCNEKQVELITQYLDEQSARFKAV